MPDEEGVQRRGAARRGDFTNALVAVAVSAAAVIAVVAPVSRGVRPSALLEHAAKATVTVPTPDAAAHRKVMSSARPRRTSPPVGSLLSDPAAEQAASCIPCIAPGEFVSPNEARPVAVEKRPTRDAVPAASGHSEGGHAVDAPPSAPASEPAVGVPVEPEDPTSPRAADPHADGVAQAAAPQGHDHRPNDAAPQDGSETTPAAPAAEDRPRNDASTHAPKDKGKGR